MKAFLREHVYSIAGIVLILIMGALFIFTRPPQAGPEVLASAMDTGAQGNAAAAVPAEAGYIMVDVVGAVYYPGVVTLPHNARVIHAIEAAGGYTAYAERRAVNGAAELTDGMQIFVPTVEEAAAGIVTGVLPPAAAYDDGLLCLNAATYAQLISMLPGIGSVRASSIIRHREAIGGFTTVEELLDISGIGRTTVDNIRPFITVR